MDIVKFLEVFELDQAQDNSTERSQFKRMLNFILHPFTQGLSKSQQQTYQRLDVNRSQPLSSAQPQPGDSNRRGTSHLKIVG